MQPMPMPTSAVLRSVSGYTLLVMVMAWLYRSPLILLRTLEMSK